MTSIGRHRTNDPEHLVVFSEEQNVSTDLIGMDAAVVIEGQFNHIRTAFIDVDLSHVPDLPEAFLRTLSRVDHADTRRPRQDLRLVRQ